jgi:hypothetical protein
LTARLFLHFSRWGLLALGALLPLVWVLQDPAGTLPGTELGDVYKHAWSYWHTPHALGAWPWTESLNAPAGGVLWDVMLFPALILSPLQALLGPVLCANLWVLLSLLAVGGSTASLAKALGADDLCASTAGFLAQGAPYLYGYPLFSGVHERLAIWLFPLLLLCGLRLKAGGGRRWVALGVGGFFFAAAGCGVYGIWALLMMALALPVFRNPGTALWGFRRQLGLYLGLAIAAVCLLLAMRLTAGADSLSPQPDRFAFLGVNWALDLSHASFSSLFSPFFVHAQQARDSGDLLLELSYVGWVQLILCCWGLRYRATRWICGIALFFVLLSTGPVWAVGAHRLVNPFYWTVAWVLPTYGSVPVPFQQLAVFSSLAGLGTLAVLQNRKSGRVFLLFAIVLGSIVERAVVLPTGLFLQGANARVSSIYGAIEKGAVVELPRDYQSRALAPGRLFLAQTRHEQGLPVSVSTGVTAWDGFLPIRTGFSSQWAEDLSCLKRGGFEWLVVNREFYLSTKLAAEELAEIRTVLGAPIATDGTLSLFSLGILTDSLDPKRFLSPFQVLEPVDNGGGGPPPEQAAIAFGIRSGREVSICPLRSQRMQR